MKHPQLFNRQALRQITYLLLSVAMVIILYALLSELSATLTVNDYDPHPLASLRFFMLYVWLPWVFIAPLVFIISRLLPVTPLNWKRQVLMHSLLLLLISLAHGGVISIYYHYFHDMDHDMSHYAAWQHIGHFLFGDQLFLLDMIIYILFVASFNLSNFYSLAQQKELETAKLNEQLSRTKLHALKMQVNPHFLFNTLNVIQVLVMKQETQKAAETLRRLSSFLRQTLDETDSQWVPLKSELDMVEQYLSIEQVRFGERLSVVCDFDQELMSTKVPAMLLQPLLENAMRHGLGEKQSDGTLWISTRKVAGNLMIKIQDDGVGCEPQKVLKDGKGIGLSNVMQRLSQLYGQQHVFDIESQPGKGCTIVIELPMKSGART